jgi:hypothetical protein
MKVKERRKRGKEGGHLYNNLKILDSLYRYKKLLFLKLSLKLKIHSLDLPKH